MEESQRLALKHDPQASGHFAYWDFVQSYVLLLRAQGAHLQQRLHIQNARKMVCGARPGWGGGLVLGPCWVPPDPQSSRISLLVSVTMCNDLWEEDPRSQSHVIASQHV